MRKYDIENIFFFEIVNLMVLAFSSYKYMVNLSNDIRVVVI